MHSIGIFRQKRAEFLPNLHHNTLLVILTDVILSSDIIYVVNITSNVLPAKTLFQA